jgi:hypothetical protein
MIRKKTKQKSEKETTEETEKKFNSSSSNQLSNQLSPSVLHTNKNGLPLEVQKEILLNVARFEGYDDFVRDTCDKVPFLFGEKGSKRRKACLSKRQRLIALQLKDSKKFSDLCKTFGFEIQEKGTVIQQPSPTVSTKETTKETTIEKTATAQQEKAETVVNNSTNNIIKINTISTIMDPRGTKYVGSNGKHCRLCCCCCCCQFVF